MPGIPTGHIMGLGPIWRFAGHQRGLAGITVVALGAFLTVGASSAYLVVSPRAAESARTDSTSQAESLPVHAGPTTTPGPPTPSPTPSLADLIDLINPVSPQIAYTRQLSLDAAQSFDTEREIVVRYLNGDIQRFDAVGPMSTSPGTGSAGQGLLVKLQWRDAEGTPVELLIPPGGIASVEVHYKDTKRELAP